MSPEAGSSARPLPKFGEWDVNDPSSAESFTVIFNKARDQKKTNGSPTGGKGSADADKNNKSSKDHKHSHHPKKVFLCFYGA